MVRHQLLIWTISDRCLGSTGFFAYLQVGFEGVPSCSRSFRAVLCLVFMLLVTFCLWNYSCTPGLMWNTGRVWCIVSVGHHAGSRPKVEGTGQPCSWWGLCSVVWCPSMVFYIRPTCPCCGVPWPAILTGAVERQGCWLCRFSWAGHLLESPVAVTTSLCAGRHLKIRRKIVPSSCLSVKQAKKISLRKRCSGLATPKEAWSHFDSPGIIQSSNTWHYWSSKSESPLVRACAVCWRNKGQHTSVVRFLPLVPDRIFAFLT